jgi:hypothetical protein
MTEPLIDVHKEEKFEFPLMKLIMQRAEEKDISILAAAKEVVPEYALKLNWRDKEYSESLRKEQMAYYEANKKNSLLTKLRNK